jgi:O-antigen/teichoic acid export membrane protein
LRRREQQRSLSARQNSAALILNFYLSSALGYIGWLAAAHLFKPEFLGLASGVISAAMLCSTISLLGLGSAVITWLPRERSDPSDLLNSFFTLVIVGALLVSGIFLSLALLVLSRVRIVADNELYAVTFVVLVIALTLLAFMESQALVLGRADLIVTRNVIANLLKIGGFGALAVASLNASSMPIVAVWAGATSAAIVIAFAQTNRILPNYRYRPNITSRFFRLAIGSGLSNHILTLTLFAPQQLFPIIVTEAISPAAAAYWYGVWMLALLTRIIPNSFAQSTFAELTSRGRRAASTFHAGLRQALGVGAAAAVVAALAAPWLLGLLGPRYAATGTTPLRIILVSVLFQTFIEFYVVRCRAERRMIEPIAALALGGLAGAAVAAILAPHYGLRGVAIAWLGAEVVTGAWAATQLSSRRLFLGRAGDDRMVPATSSSQGGEQQGSI